MPTDHRILFLGMGYLDGLDYEPSDPPLWKFYFIDI